jgi:DNA phosphorothioation-associated putative methyltransferase
VDFLEYKQLVKGLTVGKQLPDAVYVHKSALPSSGRLIGLVREVSEILKIKITAWNIIKFNKRDFKITFLNYPDFNSYAYPALHKSYTVDLTKFTLREANYSTSENPPILHRKETFVEECYPHRTVFQAITSEGEEAGLYEKTRSIGFKQNWERLIRSKGCFLDEKGRLHSKEVLAERDTDITLPECGIERHKTAIDRNHLSAPMQILARHDYFNGEHSVLDYGCGKGDDVRELEAHGIDVVGWDPMHNPEEDLAKRDIVNLGFVLNVIENSSERNETLRQAYKYANSLLIASVMIAGESVIRQFTPYKDGVITSRNTFQRYYTQSEFKEYLESTLSENAIAVGQGIFIIFKDKLEEQNFLLQRQHIRRDWKQKTQRELRAPQKVIKKELIAKNQELFDHFWETTLDLGRIPANSEFEFSERIRSIAGSHKKAFDALIEQRGEEIYLEAQQLRINDLLVYFALEQFERRKPYSHMPEGLKRDIKLFFNYYKNAVEKAIKLLFSVGNPAIIERAAKEAYKKYPIGEYNEGHSWVIPKQLLNDLPPELRIYVGCACQIYGDIDDMDLIKIHFRSGKVSLMRYDDWSKNEPLLLERIKIKLREADIDFFEYGGEYLPTPLTNKYMFVS